MEVRKRAAAVMGVVLLAGVLSGCGESEPKINEPQEQETGQYVEENQELPDEWADWTAKQIFVQDGKIHLLMAREAGDRLELKEWELQEESFADVTRQWLGTVELPAQVWMELKLMQDGNGVQYLFAQYVGEQEVYQGRLWRSDGETALEITPEKWKTINEETGTYEFANGIAVLDNGTLLANSSLSVDTLYGEDGSVLDSEPSDGEYAEDILSDGENIYLLSMNDGVISQVEKRLGGKKGDTETIPFGQSSTAGISLCVMRNGTLVSAGSDGVFRCREGEKSWEKLLSGSDTDFSLAGCWCTGLAALEDGRIYALFQKEDGETMLKMYEYDPDAVSAVNVTLKLYAVEESSLLQNAAALYHREHPDVVIETEYAYTIDDKFSGVQYDYNEVAQKLNTMLMSEDAPDILVMDYLNIDSFAEKGLLLDLNDMLTPMEQAGELLENITGSYSRGDSGRYAVPLQFAFTYITGRDIEVSNMETLESLADFLQGKDESYMGTQTVEELVDKFYPFFCGDIVDNKALNKEVLREKLKALKAVADNCGIVVQHDDRDGDGRCYGIWDLASRAKLAMEGSQSGFTGCMSGVAMTDYIKGDFTAFENSFTPLMETGISAKSKYQDIAKDFLKFALSDKVQDTDYYGGFPVNAGSLERQAAKDRSDFSAAISIETDDGGEEIFEIKPYKQETANKLVELCKSLDRPRQEDAKIREVLIGSLGDYLGGTGDLDEAVSKIEAGLKMYLAE